MVKRKSHESNLAYENKFAAQVAKYNCHGKVLAIHEIILTMMLLSGQNIDDAQRISILSYAGSGSTISATSSIADIVTETTFEKVASILPQCDPSICQSFNETHYSHAAEVSSRPNNSGGCNRPGANNGKNLNSSGRNQMSPADLRA